MNPPRPDMDHTKTLDPSLNMLIRLARQVEVAYLTRYSFSTDNWQELYRLAQEAKKVIAERQRKIG